jgi:RNA polymerase sigma-70 factor, ECF subfamily
MVEKNKSLSDEQELLIKSISGDSSSFSKIISHYESPLINFISQYTSIHQDAEDISQESFKKAFLSLSSFDCKYSFSTWLFSIARNTAIDFYRNKNAHSSVNSTLPFEELPDVIDSIGSPEECLISEEIYNSLIKSINSLPKLYKNIAYMRFIKEYAYEEIALKLDIPLNTVRTRIKRAKKILSQQQDNQQIVQYF